MKNEEFHCIKCNNKLYKIAWKESILIEAYKYKTIAHHLGYYCKTCNKFIPIGDLLIGSQLEFLQFNKRDG